MGGIILSFSLRIINIWTCSCWFTYLFAWKLRGSLFEVCISMEVVKWLISWVHSSMEYLVHFLLLAIIQVCSLSTFLFIWEYHLICTLRQIWSRQTVISQILVIHLSRTWLEFVHRLGSLSLIKDFTRIIAKIYPTEIQNGWIVLWSSFIYFWNFVLFFRFSRYLILLFVLIGLISGCLVSALVTDNTFCVWLNKHFDHSWWHTMSTFKLLACEWIGVTHFN